MKPILLFLSLAITSLGFSQKDTVYRFLTGGFTAEYGDDYFAWNGDTAFIRYLPVAGCVISEELEDSVIRFNGVTDSLLVIRFGPTWRMDYEKQRTERAERYFKVYDRVRSILIHQDFMKEKLAELKLGYDDLLFDFKESKREGWTTVLINHEVSTDYGAENWQLYKLEMELKKIKIKIKEEDKFLNFTKENTK